MMSAETLARVRLAVLALAGLTCATYSISAFVLNTPRPISPWLPGAAGLSAAVVIWVSAFAAGARNVGIAMDELYRAEWASAVQFSYWFGIALIMFGAVALSNDWIAPRVAFAALGTAYGAAPMLAFCVITLRG